MIVKHLHEASKSCGIHWQLPFTVPKAGANALRQVIQAPVIGAFSIQDADLYAIYVTKHMVLHPGEVRIRAINRDGKAVLADPTPLIPAL
jgi:hypothetical protein